jgi:hypothetical protein
MTLNNLKIALIQSGFEHLHVAIIWCLNFPTGWKFLGKFYVFTVDRMLIESRNSLEILSGVPTEAVGIYSINAARHSRTWILYKLSVASHIWGDTYSFGKPETQLWIILKWHRAFAYPRQFYYNLKQTGPGDSFYRYDFD